MVGGGDSAPVPWARDVPALTIPEVPSKVANGGDGSRGAPRAKGERGVVGSACCCKPPAGGVIDAARGGRLEATPLVVAAATARRRGPRAPMRRVESRMDEERKVIRSRPAQGKGSAQASRWCSGGPGRRFTRLLLLVVLLCVLLSGKLPSSATYACSISRCSFRRELVKLCEVLKQE